MKKIVLTAAILMGFVMGAYAFQGSKHNGGLFQRGSVPDVRGEIDDHGFFLPTHNVSTNWDLDDEPEAPLGGGIAIMTVLGAAYLVGKRREKK